MGNPEPTQHPEDDVELLRSKLSEWFARNGKDYPWRQTQDPWAILVSEIMLQQTTVSSVISNRRFERFLEEFPNLESIAKAAEPTILKAWEGLGYYNRVRNLQKTAQQILRAYGGQFPVDTQSLEALPGVGRYTAGAVSSFAFNQPSPIVDSNIARVISRLFDSHRPIDSSAGQKFLWQKATMLLDKHAPRLFNSAIMELGQTLCSPQTPHCHHCPIRSFCQSEKPELLPIKKPRKKTISIEEHAFFHQIGQKVLLAQGTDTRRKGFWHFPLRKESEYAHLKPIKVSRYSITHYRVTLYLYHQKPASLQEGEVYHPINQLSRLPIASPIRKLLEQML